MGKGKKPGGWLPGMNGRAKRTPMWVFILHLVVLFTVTVLTTMAWYTENYWQASLLSLAWAAWFVVTSLDDVRIPVMEWTRVYVLVALDSVGLGKKEKGEKG